MANTVLSGSVEAKPRDLGKNGPAFMGRRIAVRILMPERLDRVVGGSFNEYTDHVDQ